MSRIFIRGVPLPHTNVLWYLYANGLGACLSYASSKGKSREWGHALLVALRKRFAYLKDNQ